jgi:tetratricopeptide (TPR) repeat protein
MLIILLSGVLLANGSAALADDQSQRLLLRALDAEADGDLPEAVAAARLAVAADGADASAHYHLGRLLLAAGDPVGAIVELEAAAAGGRPAPVEYAAALQQAGRGDDALAALQPVLADETADGFAWLLFGHLQSGRGENDAALGAYAVAASDPTVAADAHLARARLLDKLDRKDEAAAAAEAALAAEGDSRTSAGAKALLAANKPPKAWQARVMIGHQVDTNVVLTQTDEAVARNAFTPQEISDRVGNRWTLSLGGEYRLPAGGNGQVAFGYQGYQNYHRTHRETLQRFDAGAHTPYIRYAWQQGKVSGTLPLRVSWTLLGPLFASEGTNPTATDLRLYSRGIDAAPTVTWMLGREARLFAGGAVSAVDFTEADRSVMVGAVETSVVRSNLAFAVDVGAGWTWLDSGDLRGAVGLVRSEAWGDVNAWDNEGLRFRMAARSPDLGPVHLVAGVDLTHRFYDYDYPVPTTATPSGFIGEDRVDDLLQGNVAARARWRQFVGELGVTMQRSYSTVSLFDYRRTIVSVAIGAEL